MTWRLGLLVTAGLWACSGTAIQAGPGAGGASAAANGSAVTGPEPTATTGTGDVTSGPTTTSASSSGSGGGPIGLQGCHTTPPANAPPLEPLVDPKGCPKIQPGSNTIDGRSLLVALPKDIKPGEKLPVIFLWHWLGGSAKSFFDKAQVQGAVDYHRFVAIAPESKGDVQFKWPFSALDSQARVEEEYKLFDRALTCVNESLSINRHCVASAGVSAGALWTQVLASARGKYLSSIVSLSGGEGGVAVKPFTGSPHKMPAMVLWGGPTDNCFGVFSFDELSKNLEKKLTQQGHFLLECIHNCGHGPPPFEAPNAPTPFAALWDFVLDHPGWLPAGVSPYQTNGISQSFPSWCAIGAGKAMPRTGPCKDKPGC